MESATAFFVDEIIGRGCKIVRKSVTKLVLFCHNKEIFVRSSKLQESPFSYKCVFLLCTFGLALFQKIGRSFCLPPQKKIKKKNQKKKNKIIVDLHFNVKALKGVTIFLSKNLKRKPSAGTKHKGFHNLGACTCHRGRGLTMHKPR